MGLAVRLVELGRIGPRLSALAGGCAAVAAGEPGRVEPELWHFASANGLTLRPRDEAQHGVPSARRLGHADLFQDAG